MKEKTKTVSAADRALKDGGKKLVLIASRRTDYPRFHTKDLIEGLQKGEFLCKVPMQKPFLLQFEEEDIHSIGLWSQDFSEWIKWFPEIEDTAYRFWYRFTILPDHSFFKPAAPSVDQQLEQVRRLVSLPGHSSKQIKIYIDPLIRYRRNVGADDKSTNGQEWKDGSSEEQWQRNYSVPQLETIFRMLQEDGIREVTVSVIDYYSKVERRFKAAGYEVDFFNDDEDGKERMLEFVMPFLDTAEQYGISVKSCCEKDLVAAGLTEKGACVDGTWLNAVFGPGVSVKDDSGQRKKFGCGCTKSLDIGNYSMKCGHNCPQCYARR